MADGRDGWQWRRGRFECGQEREWEREGEEDKRMGWRERAEGWQNAAFSGAFREGRGRCSVRIEKRESNRIREGTTLDERECARARARESGGLPSAVCGLRRGEGECARDASVGVGTSPPLKRSGEREGEGEGEGEDRARTRAAKGARGRTRGRIRFKGRSPVPDTKSQMRDRQRRFSHIPHSSRSPLRRQARPRPSIEAGADTLHGLGLGLGLGRPVCTPAARIGDIRTWLFLWICFQSLCRRVRQSRGPWPVCRVRVWPCASPVCGRVRAQNEALAAFLPPRICLASLPF
ncbi:hypothetical protein BD413DRAFT_69326 [Trametes elegans]|nr:hypothetical protein BD413DRAFT_69326 [Trametes elegans]